MVEYGMAEQPTRPGTFQKGHPGYKPKGPHKLTKTIKQAMIEAGEKTGSDGKGKEEIVGVFKAVARADIVAYGQMLSRLVPTEIAAEINNVSGIGQVNMVSAPSGTFLTQKQLEHLNDTGELLSVEAAEGVEVDPALRVEPEVTALMQRLGKPKPDDLV
jgi:hypothetical protein